MEIAALSAPMAGRVPAFLDDLRLLSGIDCGTHNREGVNRVGAWVADRCRENGWGVRIHPRPIGGDIVQATVPGTGSRRLLVVAHMDTVYPDGTVAERPVRVDGDKIIGPGTGDMKGGLLAGIYAVEALQALNHAPWAQVTLLFNADEEVGSPESGELILELAHAADATLVLEAARQSGAIVGARKGVREYHITVHGRSAHAGVAPDKGRNAVLELAYKVVALQGLSGTLPGVTVNVGLVRGGIATNVVPDYAFAQVDLRGIDPQSMDATEARIREIVATSTVPDTTADLVIRKGFPPMARTKTVERMITHAQAVAGELGFELEAVATGGASDASPVAGAGLAVLDGLGPIGGEAHSPNEYVLIPSIGPRVSLLAGLIARLAEQGV